MESKKCPKCGKKLYYQELTLPSGKKDKGWSHLYSLEEFMANMKINFCDYNERV